MPVNRLFVPLFSSRFRARMMIMLILQALASTLFNGRHFLLTGRSAVQIKLCFNESWPTHLLKN
jgi:hypothetical protein